MRLLIVGTLNGQLTTATKIAMDKGATVTHAADNGQAVAVTVSVGFAVAEAGDTADWGELKRVAAQAAAAAKRAGGNRSVVRALGGSRGK